MAALVGPAVSRDFTLFQFDLDEATVRRVLSSIPGVTPLPPDDETGEAQADDGGDADGAKFGDSARTMSDDEAATGDVAEPSEKSGEPSDGTAVAGSESHLGDDADERRSAGATGDRGPSTPWPGAPGDSEQTEDEGGLFARLGGKRVLLAVGLVLGLGVIGVAVVWFLRRRGDEESDAPAEGTPGADRHRTVAADVPGDSGTDDESAADADSRSYPVDPSPVVGMAFLALGALALRHFRSSENAHDDA